MTMVDALGALSFSIRSATRSLDGVSLAMSDAGTAIKFVQHLPDTEAAAIIGVLIAIRDHPSLIRSAPGGLAPEDFFAAPQFRGLGAFAAIAAPGGTTIGLPAPGQRPVASGPDPFTVRVTFRETSAPGGSPIGASPPGGLTRRT